MKATPEIKVLAECVDHRSGKRFQAGEAFTPLPTEEQATRLVLAKCLPEAAIEIAKANDAAAAKERDKLAAVSAKRQADTAALLAANAELTDARTEAVAAQAAVDAASEADAKTAAETALNSAKARLAAAEEVVAKLGK